MNINDRFAPSLTANAPHDFSTIQHNAEKNGINLAVEAAIAPRFEDVLTSLHDIGKAIEEKPQTLLSKMVQWFNRVILRRGTEQQNEEASEVPQENLPDISLEPPMPITDEMVSSLAQDFEKLFAKIKNVDSEVEEMFQGNAEAVDHLYNILVHRMLIHYKNNSNERKISAEVVLSKHEELAALQNRRKELNENISAVQHNKQFWDRVNLGCSAAIYLLTIANVAVGVIGGSPASIINVLGTLQAIATISSGGTQLVNAGIKQNSNELAGESISNKEDIRNTSEKIDVDMKLLSDSHQSLVKVIKNLNQLSEKHNQVLMSFAVMRAS